MNSHSGSHMLSGSRLPSSKVSVHMESEKLPIAVIKIRATDACSVLIEAWSAWTGELDAVRGLSMHCCCFGCTV